MLKSTFCHIPGVSLAAEQQLWSAGIHSWESALETRGPRLPRTSWASLARHVQASFEHLERGNPHHFADTLASSQHWRLFPDFRGSIAYLDIETTGLDHYAAITTIVIYDGRSVRHYVQGENLDQFKRDIEDYSMIVTYNGKCFDVPFIERYFRISVPHAHIDLRYVLKALGYVGGLKGCERQLGLDRKELADVDGFFAVHLWQDFKRKQNPQALETLLAYNATDVVNLETLMVKAYNMQLRSTPFHLSHQLPLPAPPVIPFKADADTINRLKRSISWGGGYSRWR